MRISKFKKTLGAFFVFLVFSLMLIGLSNGVSTLKPKETRNNAFVSNLNEDFTLRFPTICNYQLISDKEIYQNCNDLISDADRYIVLQLDIYGESRFSDIEIINQNDEVVPSEIVSFSRRPFELIDFSSQCNGYCLAGRFYFQIKISDKHQIKGFTIKNFKFLNDGSNFENTNLDPFFITTKAAFSNDQLSSYLDIREALLNESSNDFIANVQVEVPDEGKGGLANEANPPIDVSGEFLRPTSFFERSSFNRKHHSLSTLECNSRINTNKIKSLSVVEACNYLVMQREIANNYGNGDFSVSIGQSKSNQVSEGLEINETKLTFFENFLRSTKELDINQLNIGSFTSEQWKILFLFHYLSSNTTLENFSLKVININQSFLNSVFKNRSTKTISKIDLSGNKLTLTDLSSQGLNNVNASQLDLSEIALDNTFTWENSNSTITKLNLTNTNWIETISSKLWNNLPNLEEVKLKGTPVLEITAQDFRNLLPLDTKISSLDAEFSNTDSLTINQLLSIFESLESINIPVGSFEIVDIDVFKNNVLGLASTFSLPRNGTTFMTNSNNSVEKIFDASVELDNKIIDTDGNEISLFYDVYLNSQFRSFIMQEDYYQSELAKNKLEAALLETIPNYRSVFKAANRGMENEPILTQFNNFEGTYNILDNLVRANIEKEYINPFLSRITQNISKINTNNILDASFLNKIIALSILGFSLIGVTIYIVIYMKVRFNRRNDKTL